MKNIVLISFLRVKPRELSRKEMVNSLNLNNKKAPANGRGFDNRSKQSDQSQSFA